MNPAAIAIALALASPSVAQADQVSDLKAQLEALQKQMDALKTQLEQVTTQVQAQKEQQQQAQQKQEAKNAQFLQMAPGSGLTFITPGGGDVSLYGNFDVSFDTTTKGLQSSYE